MRIKFIYGKLELDKLHGIDSIICPTDTACSGSGGLDFAIRQAAGPQLSTALKNVQLADCGVTVTDGFQLNVKYIMHVAVPKVIPSDTNASALKICYRNILANVAHPCAQHACKTAAITLLGTGFCGWSYAQSMAALWSEILTYHREHGSEHFNNSSFETLYIYYPKESFEFVRDYMYRTSQAFFHAPKQWGYRGDYWLWYALMEYFDNPAFNHITHSQFIKEIQRFFHKKAGVWLCGDTQTYISEFDRGGMSAGMVGSFMAEYGIPLLCSNLIDLDLQRNNSPSFIIPVKLLRNSHTNDLQLMLPYELLPELVHLRNDHLKMNEQTRIPLDFQRLYYLTAHHYHSASDLIDFYSLDVEREDDIHYHFSAESAALICRQLGYMPNAIGAALSMYLKEHGGPALEAFIQKHAIK